jgi:hypothetical protein
MDRRHGFEDDRERGRAASLAVRQAKAETQDRQAFDYIWFAAVSSYQAKTLQAHADYLNVNMPKANGRSWSPKAVQRILAARGATAKSFWQRVNSPSWHEPRKYPPQQVYKAWLDDQAQYDTKTPDNGAYEPATATVANRADLVRYRDDAGTWIEGQMVAEPRPGTMTICIIDEQLGLTRDVEVQASRVEVWCWRLSRDERLALSARLQRKHFTR